jgi:hypothetical protein
MADDDQTQSVITDDGTPTWQESLAGDNLERLEALNKFESPDNFFEHYDGMVNHNWRDDFAGDDDKFKSTLERFSTPADMGTAFREAQGKIRSGQFRDAPGPDASEDDVKAYREANGIPLEAAGYMDDLPDGLVVGEEDREIMSDFMGVLHQMNVAPEVGHAVINWYNEFAEGQQDALAETDARDHQATEDQLRESWGGDYRANINLIGALIESTFGAEHKEVILNARDPDGTAIMNIPGVLEGLAELSRKVNPIAQIESQGGDPSQTLNDEIAELEKYMKDDRKAYNADEPAQARLRQLYDIRLKHEAA